MGQLNLNGRLERLERLHGPDVPLTVSFQTEEEYQAALERGELVGMQTTAVYIGVDLDAV